MVCAKCALKASKATAAPDPFRNRNAAGMLVSSASASTSSIAGKSSVGSSSASTMQKTASGPSRKIGENKLLSKNRFNPMAASQCLGCKTRLSQDKAKYCQNCSYKKGLCSMCGTVMMNTKPYKQSS